MTTSDINTYRVLEEQLFNLFFSDSSFTILTQQERNYFRVTYKKAELSGLDELDMLHMAARHNLKVNLHIQTDASFWKRIKQHLPLRLQSYGYHSDLAT
jgi:hypothetical protein